MAKVLNQLLYSSVVFGSDVPSGVLRLESTSSGTKGAVEIVGTHFDLISNTQIGRLTHSNTATRSYNFPNYSGDVLISGIFTDANQLLYSSAANTYAMLPNALGGALVTTDTGAIQWATGDDDQVLTLVSGIPTFTDLPDVGFINPSPTANQIAYYAAIGNELSPLTTISSRTLLSGPSGALLWGLIEATYLKASGGVPLGTGNATQVLTAVGDGSFAWVDKNPAVINVGTQYYLPYYSASPTGTTISQSSFLQSDETARSLKLLNRGSLRFYEATVNGTSYLEFRSPVNLGPSVSWTLPSADGVPTPTHPSFLSTDGAGNLSFIVFDSGTVNAGLANQLAYYATNGNDVSGLPTTASRILSSSALGVPTWVLLTETYFATTGGTPLGAGLLNQVLVSNGATQFKWMHAVDITGEVLSGTANYLAYYPNTGTKVDDTSFLSIDNTLKILNLTLGTKLRFYPETGTEYLEITAPASCVTTSWKLPAGDGADGHALATDGTGNLSFIEVGRGIVHTGTPNTLAYYQAAEDEVYSWPNIAERVALTTAANEISWGLITTQYLRDPNGDPLSVGTPNFALTPDGLGSFIWVDMVTVVGKVNTGQATKLAFYAVDGNQVYGSLWLNNAEIDKALELLDAGSLRFYTPSSTYYVAFKASSLTTSNVVWTLPVADGLAGQFLWTDGAGNLSWVTNRINTGTINTIPYYSAVNEISSSTLLIPTGLPASLGHTLLVDHTTGQLSYAVLVEPLATSGQIAVYTASQKVGYFADLLWDDTAKAIQLKSGGVVSFFEGSNSYSTTLKASSDLSGSTEITLPPNLPSDNGYVLTGESDGTLNFREPNSDIRWEQRGVVTLVPGMRSVTVLYDTPFIQTPNWINVQWVIGVDSSYLPTYAVEKSTPEGFIIRFSTAIPSTGLYQLNWQSYLNAATTEIGSFFIVGGRDITGYLDSIMSVLVDVGTTISLAATMSSQRSYTVSGGSSGYGYILGGSSPASLPLGTITSFLYNTMVLTDLSTTLITSRSGAGGVGTRSTIYVAGGETPGGANYSSIETFSTVTETISSFGSTLTTPSVSKGTATSYEKGAIVDNVGNIALLDYVLETLNMSGVNFGVTDIPVGANDAMNGKGYFGRDTGTLYSYSFLTDTLITLANTLNSSSGLSSAANSLDRAFFAGDALIDSLDFVTETVQSGANLASTGHMSAASSTFQSKGLA